MSQLFDILLFIPRHLQRKSNHIYYYIRNIVQLQLKLIILFAVELCRGYHNR